MFDAIKFDVAMVTQEGFDRLDKSIHYSYAWKYDHAPADDIEEKEQSDSFMEAVVTQVMLAGNDMEDYTPKYGNPAINFATEYMVSFYAQYYRKRIISDRNAACLGLHKGRTGMPLSVDACYCDAFGSDSRKYTWLHCV